MLWEFLRTGVPVAAALLGYECAGKRGASSTVRVLSGAAGWVVGYLMYRGVLAATISVETLPDNVVSLLPEGGE